jgi:hypothetical protein
MVMNITKYILDISLICILKFSFMKKFTPILLALASIAVLSLKQSNSSGKSDDFLSKNDIEILEIIQNKRKLRNSNENKTTVVLHNEEEALRFLNK